MRKIKISFLIISIVIILMTLSFFFFKFFSNKNPSLIANLDVVINNNTQGYETDSNDKLKYNNNYSFKVMNKNMVDTSYSIILDDNTDNDNSISRDKINYQLILNNYVVRAGELSDIKDNILDTRLIEKGHTNNYTFKIWTDEINTNNKVYEYKLKIGPAKN